ncbi:hypothetical protein BT96DRAFT_684615 [Gymnopus androsaceus JB14]|uniref:Uncharacterized protein n=1 Tax=Gymnopus androsaceus JB14 TaxID=1447944 RepID=A0A6A4HPD4_9AGAR|nr:hypothetical protein BT96DRAFT_684615 [Gymnopus androsaceus JB14]
MRSISLVVHINYSPNKARRMLSQDKAIIARNLRLDLTKLKLDHPPEANILIRSHEDGVSFFWETRRHSPLWNVVDSVVRLQDSSTRTTMKALKIEHMWMEESSETNPFARKVRPSSPNPLRARRIRSRSPIRRSAPDQNSFSKISDCKRNHKRRQSRSSSPVNRTRRNPSPHRRDLRNSTNTATEYMLETLRRIENVQMALLDIEKAQQQTLMDQNERHLSPPLSAIHQDSSHKNDEYIPSARPSLPNNPNFLFKAEDLYPLSSSPAHSASKAPLEYDNNTYNYLPDNDTSWVWQSNPSSSENLSSIEFEKLPSLSSAELERISDLTREFWDTRRKLTAASARYLVLERQLKASDTDLRKELAEAEELLNEERKQRQRAETVLEDVLRECEEPTIIPALFTTLSHEKFARP